MHFQQFLLIFGFSFLLTLALTFGATKFFPKWGLLDRPARYGLSRAPIPYYGGLAIFLGFLISVLVFVRIDSAFLSVLVSLSLLMIVSFLDDLFFLPAIFRLFVQVLAGVILVAGGIGIHSITNPFGAAFLLDTVQFSLFGHVIFLWSALFTVFWIVLFINSMNFLDGVPGLVSGVSFLASLTIFFLSIRSGQTVDQTITSVTSLILAASALAFFIFDFPKPKILMGDSGSVILGFLIAVLAIFSGGKIATAFLVMGFPLLDALFTIIRRLVKKQSPFRGDLGHLHHRFLKAGFSERKTVLIICLIAAIFGSVSVFLGTQQKMIALFVLLFIMSGILWIFFKKNSS
ncbi:MAG: MraY family glycosyltransferase [Patescibacteria group bacterium]